MKKPKEFKQLKTNIRTCMDDMSDMISDNLKRLHKEYENQLIDEKLKLITSFAKDFGKDISLLRSKYLSDKELDIIQLTDTNETVAAEELFDKIVIDDKDYYYQSIEKSKVFDVDINVVGQYKNSNIVLN